MLSTVPLLELFKKIFPLPDWTVWLEKSYPAFNVTDPLPLSMTEAPLLPMVMSPPASQVSLPPPADTVPMPSWMLLPACRVRLPVPVRMEPFKAFPFPPLR